ncbi:MAG: hypothetical protein JNM34_08210 [Chthonomonadaceae bacterium]|jgi:hypothetical protein|nr:hypothetical protein [Chthonomonadaceae bacterium]
MDQEQIRQLLTRAEEIQQQNAVELQAREDVEGLVEAAAEAGLDREAILQALRERISVTEKPLNPGDLAFAPSSDGNLYVAKIVSADTHGTKVRFLNGGEADLAASDLKPFAVMPGQKIYCPWPNWGWWKCEVVSYNAENQKVTVSDGFMTQMSFHLSDIRLKLSSPTPLADRSKQVLTMVAIALGSGLLGALIMRLVTK